MLRSELGSREYRADEALEAAKMMQVLAVMIVVMRVTRILISRESYVKMNCVSTSSA